MAEIRLFGLVLFITSILLSLAAVATKTSQIRFQNPVHSEVSPNSGTPVIQQPEYTSIPIAWPLIAVAATGLLFWLSFASEPPRAGAGRRRRSRR